MAFKARIFQNCGSYHTNDFIFITVPLENGEYWCCGLRAHDAHDSYSNDEWTSDDQGSVTSVTIRKPEGQPSKEHCRKRVISGDVSTEPAHSKISALANK